MKSRWNARLPALLLAALVLPALAAQASSEVVTAADSAAYQQWQTSTAKMLAASDDADALVAAAMMQKSLVASRSAHLAANKQSTKALQQEARMRQLTLMDRAAAREPDAADLAAIALMTCLDVPTCDVPAHVARYRRIAPTDALVWWSPLQRAEAAQNQAAITANLVAMGHAESFNDYWMSYTTRLRHGFADAPPPPVPSSPKFNETSPNTWKVIYVTALVSAVAMPGYANLIKPCRPDNAQFAQRRSACFAIGAMMQHGARTLISYRIGLALQRRAADNDADLQEVLATDRRLDWQSQSYSETLLQGTSNDQAAEQARDFSDAVDRTGNEITAIQMLLKKAGLPLDPPVDWVDKNQQSRETHDQRALDADHHQRSH